MLISTVIKDNPIAGNKGYKYKNIVAPLESGKIQNGTGILRARKLKKLVKKSKK